MTGNTDEANIFPVLQYRDAGAALEWLSQAFGFETSFATPGPDGTILHAETSFGAGTIMLGSATTDGSEMAVDPRRAAQSLYVAVDEVDAHHERARAAGAEITRELEDTDYGSREYSARDLEGHQWHFGTYRPSRAA